MPHRYQTAPMPASREPASLLSVDRAVAELRRGRMVAVRAAGGETALVLASEAATPEALDKLGELSGGDFVLAITARRAEVLGLVKSEAQVVALTPGGEISAETLRDIADPLTELPTTDSSQFEIAEAARYGCASAGVGLAKVARLLPAALCAAILDPEADDLDAWAARHDLFVVDAGDVFQYEYTTARTLKMVSEARVPLDGAENTRIIAFRPVDGGLEHLAVLIGEPGADAPVLTRLHSECFTGDLLGSLRCDCGEQLRAAIEAIGKEGCGALLYLAQEGRGIGLVNKLRAYELQDQGFDTIEANEQLGFDADERVYLPAAQMLRTLGIESVRLLTNNPDKVEALARCGVEVAERVSHRFPSNRHNETYLRTKQIRSGHLF
ncbi:MAG: GTP cyclohydrolase II [Rhodospirillales bacterium]|jgi:GTP cyclohydrolase II|nr:GTP cyclohydrolase II [Rhodospirillales bacterium]